MFPSLSHKKQKKGKMAWYDPIALDSLFLRFDLTNGMDRRSAGSDYSNPILDDDDNFSLTQQKQQGDKEDEDSFSSPKTLIKKQSSSMNSDAKPPPLRKSSSNGVWRSPFLRPAAAPSSTSSSSSMDKKLLESSVAANGARKHLKSFSSSMEAMLPKKHLAKSSMDSTMTGASRNKFRAGDSITPGKQDLRCVDSAASLIQVRMGPNYKKNGLKQFSTMDSLYEYSAADIFKSKRKLCNIHSQIQLPASQEKNPHAVLPNVLVINFQFPNKPPQLFRTASALEDPGTSFVLYFKLRAGTLASANNPGVKLAQSFFSQNQFEKLKILLYLDNLQDVKIPSLLQRPISKFLGKPVLLGTPLIVENGVCEVDIDVFQFPVLARTILANCRGILSTAQLRVALVIQGETDAELPERVLASCAIFNLDLDTNAYEQF